MNQNKIWKRIISIVLSLLMMIGTLNGVSFLNAKAQDMPEVTLDLVDASGSWTFSHSDLSEAYQGNSSTWSPVRYEVEAYKDGAVVPETIWIEFVGEKAYIWGNLHYQDGKVPSVSLYIPKGTQMLETIFTQSDSGNTVTSVDNGKTMVLARGLNIVYNTTTARWEQKTAVELMDVALELNHANGSWVFEHSSLSDEYQGTSEPSGPVRYQFAAYVDDATKLGMGVIEFLGEKSYIQGATFFPNGVLPTKSFKILKGTLLRECTVDESEHVSLVQEGKLLRVTEDINYFYNNESAQWEKVMPKKIIMGFQEIYESSPTSKGVIFTFDRPELNKTGVYTISKLIVDGKEIGNIQIDIPDWAEENRAYIYFQCFPGQKMPEESLIIPEGTVLVHQTTETAYVMAATLEVTNTEDGWVSGIIPPEEAPKVTMGFKEVYETSATNKGWVLTFDNPELKNTGVYTISKLLVDGKEIGNIQIDMANWTNRNWAYIYFQCFPEQKMPEESFIIPAGTVFLHQTTGIVYVTETTLEVTKTTDGWVSNEVEEAPVIPPEEAPKVLLDFKKIDINEQGQISWVLTFDNNEMYKTGFYTFSNVILDGEQDSQVKIEMPEWTNEQSADWAYIYHNQFPNGALPESSFVIPKGTILTNDSNGSVYVVAATLEVNFVDGKWESNHPYAIPDVRNDIQITFDKFDGQGYYLDIKIVAGPDYGKNVADVYGEWVDTPLKGKFTFVRNGVEESMEVLWCPCNKNQLYVIGNYRNYVTELTNVLFAQNTVLTPNSTKYSQVPMRIINDVKIEKEPVYGFWGLEGSVKTPTEFCDVTIKVKEIKGHALTLAVSFADGSEKTLGEVYGYGASVYGAVQLAEPEIGTYTDHAAVYTIQDGNFKLFGIGPAVKDSIQISAGTVLFAHNACKSSVPIRIMNTVTLTRDAEDEWVYKTGNAIQFSDSVSPQTGDEIFIAPYVVACLVSTLSIGVVGICKKKKKETI